MNKKIIGAILCVCIFAFGSIPVTGETPIDKLEIEPELKSYIDQILENNNQTFGDYFFLTNGPVLKIYSNVELLNGNENQIERINRHLSRKLFRPGIILRYIPVIAENLSFTVEYKKDVRAKSRFSYMTASATVIWNETTGEYEGLKDYSYVVNQIHKIKVENMTGFFIFQRMKLFDINAPLFRKILQSAKFWFFGFCDIITYSES